MIPFSLFQAHLKGPQIPAMETRALELSPEGFTFRLPRSYESRISQITEVKIRIFHIRTNNAVCMTFSDFTANNAVCMTFSDLSINNAVCMTFSDFSVNNAVCMTFSDFTINIEETEKYYVVLRLTTSNKEFQKEAIQLSREYLDYIEAKLYLEDAELSHQYYPEYPDEEKISIAKSNASKSIVDSIERKLPAYKSTFDFASLNFGVILRTPADRACYLQADAGAYLSEYLTIQKDKEWFQQELRCLASMNMPDQSMQDRKFSASSNTPERSMQDRELLASSNTPERSMQDLKLRYLYLGDSFCPLLFPSAAECREILLKSKADHLSLVFLLAPVPESLLETMCKAVSALFDLLSKMNMHAEIEVGDVGMLRYCEKFSPVLQVYAGILMNKKQKDPRKRYMDAPPAQHLPESGRADSLANLDFTEHAVYWPYYQTNTATFCTLQALLRHGDRSAGERIMRCNYECEQQYFRYPDHLPMVGRGNSLFGYYEGSLKDIIWSSDLKNKRIVLNF